MRLLSEWTGNGKISITNNSENHKRLKADSTNEKHFWPLFFFFFFVGMGEAGKPRFKLLKEKV
jgi:hypothetical protein